ncbi:MAG TPA: hypothetical protein VIE66_04315 [Methylocella sp.]|jgi:hypothetical protein
MRAERHHKHQGTVSSKLGNRILPRLSKDQNVYREADEAALRILDAARKRREAEIKLTENA